MDVAVLLCSLLTITTLVSGSGIVTVPAVDQFVAVDSEDNVTFTCDVSGSGSGREAVWVVQQRQIQNDQTNPITVLFASLGIFVEVLQPGMTQVTITRMAREVYLNESPPDPTITVRCASFAVTVPNGGMGQELTVTSFYPPSVPLDLRLDPVPGEVTELVISWSPPEGSLEGVALTYSISITGLSFNITNTTMETNYTFTDDPSLECQSHNFSVFASNAAGDGPAASIAETIPITPDISTIDSDFAITDVSLVDPIVLTISVPRAESCSDSRFPITGYYLSINSVLERQPLNFVEEDGDPVVRTLPLAQLEMDTIFEVSIEVCISITCRQSSSRTLRTTDVQTASIVFFETNIYMSCTFASNSNARGCLFQLQLFDQNEVEAFSLPRSSSAVSQCAQVMNQPAAYESIMVSEEEASGNITTVVVLEPTVLENNETFVSLTGCTLPEPPTSLSPPSSLSAGAVAGIVIAALIIGAAILSVVIVLLVYRVRTGQWFKLRDEEDEVTMHFEKELFTREGKLKRKSSRVGVSAHAGHESPDGITVEFDGSPLSPRSGTEEFDAAGATSPSSSPAFTLDVTSDRKRAKLHFNKALMKRVMQDRDQVPLLQCKVK